MAVRRIACDPCRRSKLACSHERPICARCRQRGQDGSCVYRVHPFRKTRNSDAMAQLSQAEDVTSSIPASSPSEETFSRPSLPSHYPNPGFLGMSSHSTIFNEVSTSTSHPASPFHDEQPAFSPTPTNFADDWAISEKALCALSRLVQMDVPKLALLVKSWLDRGVNLPLAEPFVAQCSEAVSQWTQLIPTTRLGSDHTVDIRHRAKLLMSNTRKPITIHQDSSHGEFLDQMFGDNIRWESLGIFVTAATRAVLDTCSFPSLYTSDKQRLGLIRALGYIGDCCLEICLALDCLNDLQLILQYENLIVHSQVDGDQSYHSWRRMGDVVSSLCALGYHEKIDERVSNIPSFLAQLRRACFARIYAADKSLAIFLGRPPRIVKEYCFFQLPDYTMDPTKGVEAVNYTADTRSSASFASLKEEALLMLRKRHVADQSSNIRDLQSRAEKQWQELPSHFRLSTSVKDCDRDPFERDFLAGTRLDYLHILLLIGLVSQGKLSEPDDCLLAVAGEMLSIAVEVIILRDRLVNSGGCLIWKVAQFGLPAAGVISLALLQPIGPDTRPFPRSKMVQDLSALVAEITIGAWIQAGEPNFALFTRVTRTIQSLLDSLMAWKPQMGSYNSQRNQGTDLTEDWNTLINSQPLEFEMDFWASLAEHPTLLG